jgi:ribonuclease E
MSRKMLINVIEQEECRIATIEDGKLDEYYAERTDRQQILGNIYKGRILNVEPAIQAAFVDFGGDRNGFLHASDVMPAYGQLHGTSVEDDTAEDGERDEPVNGGNGRTRNGRRRGWERELLPVEELLRRGQEVLVQVTKEAIGEKGPSLTTYLSLPGRFLVLMPSISRCGISRKITDDGERRKLKRILDDLDPPGGMGYIVRTAGVGRTRAELKADLDYLLRLWKVITERIRDSRAPAMIYQESDLVIRSIRDYLTRDVDEVLLDSEMTCERVKEFLTAISPGRAKDVHIYRGKRPLFSQYRLEEQIDEIYRKKVTLPSGGTIVIEQTEALVSIDVNSGKSTGEKNLEDTAYKTNLEAAEEIARQLRLRDVGGVIVNDFIDMRDARRRRELEHTLRNALRRDRARTKVARMSPFGIIEMTRQRIRTSKEHTSYQPCHYCRGSGSMRTPENVALTVLRRIRLALSRRAVCRVEVKAADEVASFLLNRKRRELAAFEEEYGKEVRISVEPSFIGEEISMTPLNERGSVVRL